MRSSILVICVTMLLCYAVGCLFVVTDLASVPVHNDDYYREHPEWRVQDIEYPEATWEICLGDGEVTALENIFIWVSLLWGFMRTVDLVIRYETLDELTAWEDFWERIDSEILQTL